MSTATPDILLREKITPVEAVRILYGADQDELARAIVASLNRRIFTDRPPVPSNAFRRTLARMVFHLMRATTRADTRPGPDGHPVTFYRNAILEKSGHPYAATLLEPSRADTAAFVEGGDPMNSVYMMLSREIFANAGLWDHIMLDSVQARDVQLRLLLETRLTHELAVEKLRRGEPVRLKAAAAGTGLSMALVLDKLLSENHDPRLITAVVTDREASNVEKNLRLLAKLDSVRPHLDTGTVTITVEDLVAHERQDAPFHIVTLMGLLEYFPGYTNTTTEEHLGLPAPHEKPHAEDIVRKLGRMTADQGFLLTNSYRLNTAARILENFGKRFRYRGRPEMQALLATGGFTPTGRCISGNIFDVEIFTKQPAP